VWALQENLLFWWEKKSLPFKREKNETGKNREDSRHPAKKSSPRDVRERERGRRMASLRTEKKRTSVQRNQSGGEEKVPPLKRWKAFRGRRAEGEGERGSTTSSSLLARGPYNQKK